jgi:light-regulated signal transduction histidine kinase (bacteriophytochrome)
MEAGLRSDTLVNMSPATEQALEGLSRCDREAIHARVAKAAALLKRAASPQALCEAAADEFRLVTDFDRVLIYRFLSDEAGTVLAESRRGGMKSFLNHHFPGSDIPAQARALYVRNLVRVIPDTAYKPLPLRPPWSSETALDMSDSSLRSVSPIHLVYLANMACRLRRHSLSFETAFSGAWWPAIIRSRAT